MKSKIITILMIILIIFLFGILIITANYILGGFSDEKISQFVTNIAYSENDNNNVEIIEDSIFTINTITSLESNNKSNINIQNSTNKYFYEQLEEESKIIYKAFEDNKQNIKTGNYEINLGDKFSDLLIKENGQKILGTYFQSSMEAYLYDYVDVFYLDISKLCLNIETRTRGYSKTFRVFINSGNNENYLTKEFNSKEQIDIAESNLNQIKNYVLENKKLNTYDNIKMVHDYLINTIEYDSTLSEKNIYNIYGALVNRKCVCEGYSKAFKYLMDALDIPSIVVIGKGIDPKGNMENHAWNYVKIDENWYGIDCTWDDPIIIGNGRLDNVTKYRYFLKGKEEFDKSHIPEGKFTSEGQIFTYPSISLNNYK